METKNITFALCVVLLFANLTKQTGRRRHYGWHSGWRSRSRNCGFLNRVECDELTNPANGTVSLSGRDFEDVANYSCNSGFELVGGSTRTCLSDETWSGTPPTCVFAGCGPLSAPMYGNLNLTGQQLGDTATVTCDRGYELTGPGFWTCLESGWDGTAADCVPVTCPVLANPTNGSVSIPAGTEFEDEAVYSCYTGFELSGNNRRCCLSTGSWSGTDPTCVPTGCGSLSTPVHGDLNLTGRQFGDTVTVTCDVGYEITGSSTRTCLVSGWNGIAADCVPVTCPVLANPTNGSVSIPDGNEIEDEAVYSCDPGFELSGNSRRCCRSSGSWSGTAPTCVQIVQCPVLTNPVDGAVDVSGLQPIGTMATYTCDFGLITGDLVRYCLEGGLWSGSAAMCAPGCGPISVPMYGDLSLTGRQLGDTATVTCDRGYEITGSSVRTCLVSGWNGTAADCVPVTCPVLTNLTDGSVSTPSGTEFEDEAIYSCNTGFELSGNNRRCCLSTGSWSGTAPTCMLIVQCPALTDPIDGSVNVSGLQLPGTIANYICNFGLVTGDLVRYCSAGGVWSGSAPTCSPEECPALTAPADGTVDASGPQPLGTTATYTCDFGLISGDLVRTCLVGGSWNGSAPTCSPEECPALPAPVNGTVDVSGPQPVGTTATYTCDFALVTGDLVRTCLVGGSWNGSAPICSPEECPALTAPADGTVDASGPQPLGTTATYTCDFGLISGDLVRTCLVGGSWNGSAPTCSPEECPALPAPANGTVDVSGPQPVGTTATYTCDFALVTGDLVRTCLVGGSWNGSAPICSPEECPALTAPTNGTVDVSGPQPLGTTATYTCDFSLVSGDLVRTCFVGGSWNGSAPTCSPGVRGAVYIGCYADAADRDLSDVLIRDYDGNTPQKCINLCTTEGFMYAGVQAGYACLCGNSYGKYGNISESMCQTSCPGDETQTCGGGWANAIYEILQPAPLRDCNDIFDSGVTSSGVYSVVPCTACSPVDVYCDMTTDGGAWTVFQRREDGSQDFFLYWQDYKDGFGNLSGEFWLGLENLYNIVSGGGAYELRVDLEDFDNITTFAQYGSFSIGPESSNYTLAISGYNASSTAGDSMTDPGDQNHNGQQFSTRDRDNDNFPSSCADLYKGAWWYNECHRANLNGLYQSPPFPTANEADGVNWWSWKGYRESLKRSVMMIRRI